MVYLFGTIKIKIETWWFECKSFRLLLRHANSESSLSPHSSIAVLTDSIKSRISTVNFINVNLARFLYKRHFGTFFKLHVRWKSCRNGVRTKKVLVKRWWNWHPSGSFSENNFRKTNRILRSMDSEEVNILRPFRSGNISVLEPAIGCLVLTNSENDLASISFN